MKHFLMLLTFAAVLGTGPLWAGPAASGDAAPQIVAVKNAMCPLSGDKAKDKFFYDYQGKRYHFCCPNCIKDFKKDPEEYIAKLKK